jgi:hypothetical protein
VSGAPRIAGAVAILLSTAIAACQPSASSGSAAPPGGSAATPTGGPSTLGPPASPTPGANAPARVDPTLLDYLPEMVGDATMQADADEAAIAAADPALSRVATAVDVGVALHESSGDLVTAHVVRLRHGAFDDATYRDWRDTFDEGACGAAGGVHGRAETPIDDRTVYVTTCVAQVRIYHVWIEEQDLLISASSFGSAGYGELLVHGLRLP